MSYKNLFPNIGEKLMVIDLETLGVNSKSPILSIGYVVLEVQGNVLYPIDTKLIRVRTSGLEKFFVFDYSTVKFWMEQDEGPRKAMFEGATEHLTDALPMLRHDYEIYDCQQIWSRHPTFDITILNHAFDAVSISLPWKYNHPRDTATVSPLVPKAIRDELKKQFTYHDALEDAKYEAGILQELYHYDMLLNVDD